MSENMNHELHDFLQQTSDEMAAEYNRIQKRATKDPGTAGDQGEENWAELLQGWIPSTYKVVTKGRIISQDGRTSPQIDVLVLKDVYPKKLLNKKLYLAAGVAAAFECKTTLKASHIEEAVKTCALIKNLCPSRVGTPYQELHAPVIYGLLAHSHSWKGENSKPRENVTTRLLESDQSHISHPRECLDVLCVADLATWAVQKITFMSPRQLIAKNAGRLDEATITSIITPMCLAFGPDGSALSNYIGYTFSPDNPVKPFTPIGVFIYSLSRMLAWENLALRDLASYYEILRNFARESGGPTRQWPSSIYSEKVRHRVEAGGALTNEIWNEWAIGFPLAEDAKKSRRI